MTLTTLASLLILSAIPLELATVDEADLVEVNHFYDECGKHIFDQIIWYDWHDFHSKFEVRAWRIVKGREILPKQDHSHNGWIQTWLDGEIIQQMRSANFRESWTQFDPELCEREWWPAEQRRGLRE